MLIGVIDLDGFCGDRLLTLIFVAIDVATDYCMTKDKIGAARSVATEKLRGRVFKRNEAGITSYKEIAFGLSFTAPPSQTRILSSSDR